MSECRCANRYEQLSGVGMTAGETVCQQDEKNDSLGPPPRTDLGCFVYGVFKPGELAHFQVEQLLAGEPAEALSPGRLWIRDGLPLLSDSNDGSVSGYLLRFRPESARDAFAVIGALEPRKHYDWKIIRLRKPDEEALVLVGRDLPWGAEEAEGGPWSSRSDPLFTAGLEVVTSVVKKDATDRPHVDKNHNIDWHRVFRLEAAYLLLWSAIERFTALRYGPWRDAMQRIKRLGEDPVFATALNKVNPEFRVVFDSRRPDAGKKLDVERPRKAAEYYYQVRSNLAHRGKAAYGDAERIKWSLVELLEIFTLVLSATQNETGEGSHDS